MKRCIQIVMFTGIGLLLFVGALLLSPFVIASEWGRK